MIPLLLIWFTLLSCGEKDTKPYPPAQARLDANSYTDKFGRKVRIIPRSFKITLSVFDENYLPKPFSIKIHKDLPEYTFTFHGKKKPVPTNPKIDFYYLSHIEVMDSSTSKVLQKIEHKDRFEGYVSLPDLNQDGYLDLIVFDDWGGSGGCGGPVHIFQPESKLFKRHSALSKMYSVMLDDDSKLIASYRRSGGDWQFGEYFSMQKNDKLLLEKVEWTEEDRLSPTWKLYKVTAVPRGDRNITYLGRKYDPYNKDFVRFLHQKVKVVKKEEFYGRLDARYKHE
jgi:hypothetical protein